MNKSKIQILLITIGLLFFGCEKNNINDTNPETKILGHRAYGIKGYNDTIMDNTLPAITKALYIADGVEVDIQMSQEGTIWLYHDTKIYDIDSNIQYIPNLGDDELLSVLTFNHPFVQFTTLPEVFKYFDDHKINQIISLDVKSFYGETCFENTAELNSYMLLIGEKIIDLAKRYGLENQILIESDIKFLLDYIKMNSTIKTFLLGYSDFTKRLETARQNNYTGVSHFFNDPEITSESIKSAQKTGIQIQLWTPNTENELKTVLSLQPNFIQTDNIHYFENNL